MFLDTFSGGFNSFCTSPTKWSNTLKQFVGHLEGLVLKGLIKTLCQSMYQGGKARSEFTNQNTWMNTNGVFSLSKTSSILKLKFRFQNL